MKEVVQLLAARAPRLDRALRKIAQGGGVVVLLDGTLIRTRRRTGKENRKHFSGKHKAHGLLFLALTDEKGNLIWISAAKPGRSSEITTARHNKITGHLREAGLGALADLGFVGLDDKPADDPVIITGHTATRNHKLTAAEREANRLVSRERAANEHGFDEPQVMADPDQAPHRHPAGDHAPAGPARPGERRSPAVTGRANDHAPTITPPVSVRTSPAHHTSPTALRKRAWRNLSRWQSAEALDVDGDGGQDVLDVGLSLPSVATAPHAVAVGELVDRALHSGADRIASLPLGRLLLGTDTKLQVAELSRGKAHSAGTVGGARALGTGRAGATLTLGEPGHDQRGRSGRGGRIGAVPARADLPPRAGDLLTVVSDVEVIPGKALTSAVLAGGVARQWSGDGDLVFAGDLFQVGQRGVAAVDEVLDGQQAATGQARVDAGQDLAVMCGGRGGGHVRDHVGAVGSRSRSGERRTPSS